MTAQWYPCLVFGMSITRASAALSHPGPVVGVPVPIEQAQWRAWVGDAYLLSASYVHQLRSAGAIPFLLPVGGGDAEARRAVDALDGLMLAGGSDVQAHMYGADPHPESGPYDPARDEWELALIRAAVDARLPVLGICRGMQLLNVAAGGTLIQHLPDVLESNVHNPTVGCFTDHHVRVEEGSELHRAVGASLDVPTYHHQAVGELADAFVATGWADDGTLEAFESEDGRVLAVQWHPEAGQSTAIFEHFVRACAPAGAER